jgi:predicted site-specific integrase-resolvase
MAAVLHHQGPKHPDPALVRQIPARVSLGCAHVTASECPRGGIIRDVGWAAGGDYTSVEIRGFTRPLVDSLCKANYSDEWRDAQGRVMPKADSLCEWHNFGPGYGVEWAWPGEGPPLGPYHVQNLIYLLEDLPLPFNGRIRLTRKEAIMTQILTESEGADATTARRAVIYLRVSSSGQVGRENDVEGYSIPAQREACRRRAQSLGAVVEQEQEFVDYAESARSADRPQLKAMLNAIKKESFDYLIIYDLSRLARNRLDDALLMVEIQAAGTKLVSVAENVDETPAGMLTHGVLAAVNEFRSRGDAEKVKLGLRRKHLARRDAV